MMMRVLKSLQTVVAHTLLFSFTLLLVLQLNHSLHCPWWIIFSPLWLFHAVVARGRFSLPAPSMPYDRHWAPFHAVMATPLLVSFELLICIYLEADHVVSLKIVFLPLLAFQTAILVDNIRMCRALMPGDDENMTDEAIWETLPHFWVAISMVFFIAATTFTLLKLCGDVEALGWWDLFINYGVAEFFAFLTCTKWYNPVIHRNNANRSSNSLSTLSYHNWNSGLLSSLNEEAQQSGICNLEDIGGHVMKIPLIGFQILLVMRLEGTPAGARNISIPVLFFPLFLLQGAALLFSMYRFLEKIILFIGRDAGSGMRSGVSPIIRDCMGFMRHGSRLLGWWSIDEGSQEERARLYYSQTSGYSTFPPDSVKKMPKAELTQEIWRLNAALSEQTEISKFSQEEFERLQHEKILCRICFDEQINIVLLPCRHYILCSMCSERCKRCPICRVYIEDRLPIYDV